MADPKMADPATEPEAEVKVEVEEPRETEAAPAKPAAGIPVAYEIPGGGWGIRYE